MFVIFTAIAIILVLIYYYGVRTYDYWEKRGVPYVKPKYPYFGNLFESAISIKPGHLIQIELYKYFKNARFGGFYIFKRPCLFIRDPELIETILIKDFSSFHNRNTGSVDPELEPLSMHLLNLKDAQWKNLRQKLTPTFSSGKLKTMHTQLVDCADLLVNYLESYSERAEPIEGKIVFGKFASDVIASCAFGLNTNSLSDNDSEILKISRKLFTGLMTKLRFMIRSQYPSLIRLLKWKALDQKSENFFFSLVKSTMAYREKNNVVRNDFLQLFMELKKKDLGNEENLKNSNQLVIDDRIITSNSLVFLVAGFETTATTISYCLYELSLHPEIQEQTRQHVLEILEKHNGEYTYEAIKDMTLITQILSETLRLHPPATEIRRISNKEYTIPGTNLTLPAYSVVAIPVYSLHRDPEYFPEPEKFDINRFSKDNINKIKKGTYLPFGDGPRICIGKRFAEMEMYVALAKLIVKYKFSINSKTHTPLEYEPSAIILAPKGGIWLDIHKR